MSLRKETTSASATKYRPDIDGIRAIAVLSVVFCHAFPAVLPGGFIGVDIFFVISGYLISSILLREIESNKFSLLKFYDRRIKRIFPALIAVLIFTLALGWICLFRPEFQSLGKHVVASTLFSENFLLWSEAGYFDSSSKLKPVLHLWSLAIEEQFYILWPVLMLLTHRRKINFILVVSILGGVAFCVNIHDIYANPTAAYYSPIGRSWELMVGSGLAYAKVAGTSVLDRYKNFQAIFGAALIILALALVRPDSRFPGFWALLPTVGTFLLLSAGEGAWVNRRVLSIAPMVWCGLVSYPLYLWHWPLLSFGYFIYGDLSPAKATVAVVAAVCSAVLTYLVIERPIRRLRRSSFVSLSLTVCMVIVLILGAFVTIQVVIPRLSQFDAVPNYTEWDFLSQKRVALDEKNFYHLHRDRKDQVLFIGDSHLAHYAPRLDKLIGDNPNLPGAVFAMLPGCIPVENWGVRKGDDCGPLKDRAYQLAMSSRFKRIVIGGAWDIYFTEPGQYYKLGDREFSLTSAEGRALGLRHLQQRISELIKAGKEVVLVLDNPVSGLFNPTGPSLRLSLSTEGFESNAMIKIAPVYSDLHRQMTEWAKQSGARVIDPKSSVCSGDMCRVTTESGQPLYRNRDHFNPVWALQHASFIDQALM